ncbi:hypothetical protein CKO42_16010 [Lamprobacter modestohalophilus]|uniref:DUF2304 domain-containing protein n=1 Tax=Lamprobacter modestohalophilus TaxID=1064514 RepID=A0A9X1B5S0_9GAMM|nr:DUF2304 domain-containing protein [Lamprobacter modestohalophilus]MBK1619922.1 hypothetical protein [Lamprobacter modestohalophilus]
MTYQWTSIVIGLALASTILWLVRRSHLHGPYALWWVGVGVVVVGLGFFPRLFDLLASQVGVNYPPILAVVLGFSLLLIKMLTMDLERSRQERQIRRMAQRMAILEARLAELRDRSKTERDSA